MKTIVLIAVVAAAFGGPLAAQETKPVPKDSVRVLIRGCSKGRVFTAGARTEDQPSRSGIPEGMHLRMNGPKTMMAEIKGHEGSMVEISGLVKQGELRPEGVGIGHGVRITPGPSPTGGSLAGNVNVSQVMIDVEGWRPALGSCPLR